MDTLSIRVNELVAAYVAMEAKQHDPSTPDDEADALGVKALAVMDELCAIDDRSGNADLAAAVILMDIMLHHCYPELGKFAWDHEEDQDRLKRLTALSGVTTGEVRKHVAAILATVGTAMPTGWEGRYANEAVRLRAMTPAELIATAMAYRASRDGLQSIHNMPRCDGAATDLVEDEIERAGDILDMAMQELERRPLEETHTDEDRVRAIVVYELVDCGGTIITTLGKITAMQAELARQSGGSV